MQSSKASVTPATDSGDALTPSDAIRLTLLSEKAG